MAIPSLTCRPGPVAQATGEEVQADRNAGCMSGSQVTEAEVEGPSRPTLWRSGRECTKRARPEFSRATGGAVVFVYIKKGRGEKGRQRKWERRENEPASEQTGRERPA